VTTIIFKNWTLIVDEDCTRSTYNSVNNGSAEDCSCVECLNYLQSRDIAFPEEIKSLFGQLGIDYKKESEIWRMCKEKDGYHRYSLIFHFMGSFNGNDCSTPYPSGGQMILTTPITESFSIGFTMADDLAYFKDKENLVQVEIETMIPWMMDSTLESEW
jgi:hypothetical protein